MSTLDRAFGFIALGLVATLCAALGGWWWVDRGRQFERPQWDENRFEAIGMSTTATSSDRETWVIAVNPDCSHCLTTLAAIADTMTVVPGAPRLFALVVDTRVRPAERTISHPRLDGVFWDREQVWRTRWGHRVYGELLRFDATGEWNAARHRGG